MPHFYFYVLYSGIMFPVECKNELPLDHILINSVSVRGRLGPISVYVCDDYSQMNNNRTIPRLPGLHSYSIHHNISRFEFPMHKGAWTKVYQKTLPPSYTRYKSLHLDVPIKLRPGDVKAIYIHSTLHSDKAIVYDNTPYSNGSRQLLTNRTRYEDNQIRVYTGRAHVSPVAFSDETIWGWGSAWRDRREFVGQIDYGVIYQLWQPTKQLQLKFPLTFQDGARMLFLCQRRFESPFSLLPDECIFYILNMCKYNWFQYDPINRVKVRRKKRDKKIDNTTTSTASSTAATGSSSSDGCCDAAQERAVSSARWNGVLRKLNVFAKKRNYRES